MIWLAAWLYKLPILWRLGVYGAVALSLWGGYVYWKTSIYNEGYRAGEVRVQDEWNAAVKKEVDDGEQAGADAVRDVDRAGPRGMSDDPWNRDNWSRKEGKPGT